MCNLIYIKRSVCVYVWLVGWMLDGNNSLARSFSELLLMFPLRLFFCVVVVVVVEGEIDPMEKLKIKTN